MMMGMADEDDLIELAKAMTHLAAGVIAIKTAVGFISLAETSPTADVSTIYREVNGNFLSLASILLDVLNRLKRL
jgi:hypothetical protein